MVLVISEKRKYFPLIQAHSCSPSHPYQNPIHNNAQKSPDREIKRMETQEWH